MSHALIEAPPVDRDTEPQTWAVAENAEAQEHRHAILTGAGMNIGLGILGAAAFAIGMYFSR